MSPDSIHEVYGPTSHLLERGRNGQSAHGGEVPGEYEVLVARAKAGPVGLPGRTRAVIGTGGKVRWRRGIPHSPRFIVGCSRTARCTWISSCGCPRTSDLSARSYRPRARASRTSIASMGGHAEPRAKRPTVAAWPRTLRVAGVTAARVAASGWTLTAPRSGAPWTAGDFSIAERLNTAYRRASLYAEVGN